jgi:hypothetical protein
MANELIVVNNQDAVLVEVDAIPAGYSNDGIFYKTVSGKHYKIPNDGTIRAVKAGVKFDGTDQTTRINTLLAHADIHELIFDAYGQDIKVDGTVNVDGKKLSFRNNCKLIGTGTIDNALIEADINHQVFATTLTVTNIRSQVISVCWFGAVADSTTTLNTDNLIPFQKTIEASNTANTIWHRSVIRVPGTTDDSYYGLKYGFSDVLEIEKQVIIIGDNNRTSVMVFPGDGYGIIMRVGSHKSVIKHIGLWGRYAYNDPSTGYNEPDSGGLLVQSNGGMYEDLWINGFDGDGIQNVGDVGSSTNSNNNHYTRCYITYNGRHGMFFAGGDANQCTIDHCDIVGNARHSIYENSFLGNSFLGVHSASNGSIHPKSRSTVRHGGVSYWAIQTNTNIEPGVTSGWQSYWQVTSGFYDPSLTQYQWNNTDTFYVGGSYYLDGANQRGAFINCYAEDDEMKVFPNQASTGTARIFGFAEGPVSMSVSSDAALLGTRYQVRETNENINLNIFGKDYGSVSWTDVDSSISVGFKYYKVRKVIAIDADNADPVGSATWFAHTQFPASLLGLAATPRGATLINGKIFIKKETGYYNSLSFRETEPDSGEYAAGDIVINCGSDNTILGWKCTTSGDFAGTDPVFEEIAIGGGGGGSGINNSSTLQTSAQFNIDGQGKAASFNATTATAGFYLNGNKRLYDAAADSTIIDVENDKLTIRGTVGDPYLQLRNAAASRGMDFRLVGNDIYLYSLFNFKFFLQNGGGDTIIGGLLNLSTYGTGTHTGTLAKLLGVTSAGDTIEVDPASVGGSGGVEALNVQYTDVANSGTSETDLMSYTLPANQLLNVGDRIVIEAIFTTPANGNNKTLRFYFGSSTQSYSPSAIASGATLKSRITIIKTGASTQKIVREFDTGFTTIPGVTTAGITDTATIVIKYTGESNTASNDISQKTLTVTYYPAP